MSVQVIFSYNILHKVAYNYNNVTYNYNILHHIFELKTQLLMLQAKRLLFYGYLILFYFEKASPNIILRMQSSNVLFW